MKNDQMDAILAGFAAGETPLEEANAALEAARAPVRLVCRTEAELGAKRQREDAEGYLPPDGTHAVLPKRPDMRRRPDLSGQTVRQRTAAGTFDVDYDEDGYAVRAMRAD